VHDGRAFAQVGPQPYPRGVGDAHSGRDHVIHHFGKFIHAIHRQGGAFEACGQLAPGQLLQINGTLAGPGNIGQNTEHAVEHQIVGFDQAVGQQMQFEVDLRYRLRLGILGNHRQHRWPGAALQAAGKQGQFAFTGGLKGAGELRQGVVVQISKTVAISQSGYIANHVGSGCGRGEQWLRVENFQPLALAVAGADAQPEAVKSCHGCLQSVNKLLPGFFIKTCAQAVANLQHRPFNKGRVSCQQRRDIRLSEIAARCLIEVFPGGAALVEQRL